MVTATNISTLTIREVLETISDPEIPVLSIIDMGIIRDVIIKEDQIEIIITPTYSGCPAMDMISMQIKMTLLEKGYKNILVKSVLAPAWSTDWMSENGKKKLQAYGIAPPVYNTNRLTPEGGIECPQCHSHHTKLLSEFGSTACKALFQCSDCKEPFDYFKCH